MNGSGGDLPMLKLCVAGAAGRMGNAIIQEAAAKGHQTVGAVEASSSPAVGKTLKELGICDCETRVVSPDHLSEAVRDADVYVTFTAPAADVVNVPIVAL